jgi:hypothetical protein
MKTILVRDYADMALTERDGMKLRAAIERLLQNEPAVLLDFSGISLFATMFFNASIGHLVMQLSPTVCAGRILITNISDLGRETYQHTFENARDIFSQHSSLEKIADVTQTNLDNA